MVGRYSEPIPDHHGSNLDKLTPPPEPPSTTSSKLPPPSTAPSAAAVEPIPDHHGSHLKKPPPVASSSAAVEPIPDHHGSNLKKPPPSTAPSSAAVQPIPDHHGSNLKKPPPITASSAAVQPIPDHHGSHLKKPPPTTVHPIPDHHGSTMKKPPPAAEAPPELKSDSEDSMHGGENTDTDHEDDMDLPPTILKMEGKPPSAKRKAVLLEESDGEEEDHADAGEEGHPGKGAMKKETSDRTCQMVQWWSDHHPPTKTFTSTKRWGGPHGGAAAKKRKGKKMKMGPFFTAGTPFTDGSFLANQPRLDELLYESMSAYADKNLRGLQNINEKAIIWTTQEFNDWNQKESARIERVKAEGVIGLKQIKKMENEYKKQRRLWNSIADTLKEEYLVNKRLAHGVVVGLKQV